MNNPKLKIIYNNKGTAYSDFNILEAVDSIIEDYNDFYNQFREFNMNYEVKVSTDNFLLGIRLAITKNKINNEDVIIVYDDVEYHLDEYGAYIEIASLENCQTDLLDQILEADLRIG